MTCIAAAKQGDRTVVLAADQQINIRGGKDIWKHGKIFRRGAFAYGCSGYVRAANILREAFSEPPRAQDSDTLGYLVGSWIPAWRDALQNGGCKVQVNNEDSHGISIIMVYEGRIFTVSSDFSVVEANAYAASGSGAGEAMGAMFVATAKKSSGIAQFGVMAAIAHADGCGGEVDVLVIKNS